MSAEPPYYSRIETDLKDQVVKESLENKFDQLWQRIERAFDQQQAMFNERFTEVDKQFLNVDKQFVRMEQDLRWMQIIGGVVSAVMLSMFAGLFSILLKGH